MAGSGLRFSGVSAYIPRKLQSLKQRRSRPRSGFPHGLVRAHVQKCSLPTPNFFDLDFDSADVWYIVYLSNRDGRSILRDSTP